MILVTGGAGFIGSHLCHRLRSQGEEVLVVDDFSRSKLPDSCDDRTINCDIRDYEQLQDDLVEANRSGLFFDEVIHLAAVNGTKNFYEEPAWVLQVAIQGIVNIETVCHKFGVKKFILMSSSEVCRAQLVDCGEAIPLVIPDPYNPRYSYSAGKIISEMVCLHSPQFDRLVIVRPFNIYGPGMAPGHVVPDIIEQFKQDDSREPIEIKLIGSGEETRSFCYIDDLIDGLMIARERGEHRGIYNIGNPQETTIKHLAETIGAISGKNFNLEFGNAWREGDLPRRRPDISKLVALGYEPKMTLWNGLRATMETGR